MTMDTAKVTGADVPPDMPIKRSAPSHVNRSTNRGSPPPPPPQPLAPIRIHLKRKYRHVAAAHTTPRASCLSHDSEASPSFLGFRNLMIIVLGRLIWLYSYGGCARRDS